MDEKNMELVTDTIESYEPAGTTKMIRDEDGRINHVDPENVQDYLDSGLWKLSK